MFAYVIFSYDKPALVHRLVHRLRDLSPDAVIVLRHDKRRCAPPDDLPAGVRLGGDGPVEWGHWTMVEAELQELAWVRDNTDATHAVLISGQDYPVLPLADWEPTVAHLDGIINAERIAFRPRWGRRRGYSGDETMIRYGYRWFTIPGSPRWDYTSGLVKTIDRIAARAFSNIRPAAYYRILPRGRGTVVGIRRRWNRETYKGETWMMLSRRAIGQVLSQDLTGFRRTLLPEESAIQTAALTSPGLDVRLGAVTYTSWVGSLEHPQMIGSGDLEAIAAGRTPFARKVDISPILDELDRMSQGRVNR